MGLAYFASVRLLYVSSSTSRSLFRLISGQVFYRWDRVLSVDRIPLSSISFHPYFETLGSSSVLR